MILSQLLIATVHPIIECVLDQCSHFTAAGLFQCINICTLNSKTRLRLEFIVYNGHQGLTFESWSWWSHFTAAGLFQCINICTLNGKRRLRLEFMVCNGHQGPTLGSWWSPFTAAGLFQCINICILVSFYRLQIPMLHPNIECVLDQCSHFTAAGLFQCINICILNGKRRLRLEFVVCNGHQGPTFESWSLHCCWTVPMHQHMHIEWHDKVEIGIHGLQWSPGSDL
eukprot:scaffold116236_cov45-Cyclotella_meneghiniana.AAC.1